MTRAEQMALEAYPVDMQPLNYQDLIDSFGGKTEIDVNTYPRALFQQGYKQAEKDLIGRRPEQWKWINPKYEYPLCLTREMDEYGDWHYALSSGKISETCQYISLAELERLPDEPVDADAAMKELDEKIKLTKEHGSWEGVDVNKFMDDVRGRESGGLEEAVDAEIVKDIHNLLHVKSRSLPMPSEYKFGEKVKIIILKRR